MVNQVQGYQGPPLYLLPLLPGWILGFGLCQGEQLCLAKSFLLKDRFFQPTPVWSKAQQGINVINGIGQAGPLTLITTQDVSLSFDRRAKGLYRLIQFCSPPAYLATASGLAYSARAIGGGFGGAIVLAISEAFCSHLSRILTSLCTANGILESRPAAIAQAAIAAGLPATSVGDLLKAMALGVCSAADIWSIL